MLLQMHQLRRVAKDRKRPARVHVSTPSTHWSILRLKIIGFCIVVAGLTTQRNAISMLHSRIGAILEYLKAVQIGQIAPDPETLRQISSLVSSVSAAPTEVSSTTQSMASTSDVESSSQASEFQQEQSDVMLTSLLGLMTKNLDEINMLVDKFGIAHAKDHGRGDDEMFGMNSQGRNRGGGGHRKTMADARRHGRGEGFF
jgi:hypothetical protein